MMITLDKDVVIVSSLCIIHILLNNAVLYYFSSNPYDLNFDLYFNIINVLDIMLIVSCLTLVKGRNIKLVLFISSFVVMFKIIFLNFPLLNTDIAALLFSYSYTFFIESFLLINNNYSNIKSNMCSLSAFLVVGIYHIFY